MISPRIIVIAVIGLIAAACGDSIDVPPILPGAEPPPCELTTPRGYLISELATPDTLGSAPLRLDLDVPPDGRLDHLYPGVLADPLGTALPQAIQRALDEHHLLWVLVVERCSDPIDPYARVLLARGTSFEDRAPMPHVTLAHDEAVWSVGAEDPSPSIHAIDAADGIAVSPVALPVDLAADTAPTAWIAAQTVTIHAEAMTDQFAQLTGYIAHTFQVVPRDPPAPAVDAIGAAIARSLTIARAANPNCPPECSHRWLETLFEYDRNADRLFGLDEGREALGWFNVYADQDHLAVYNGETVFWPDHDQVDESVGVAFWFVANEVTVSWE